MANVGLCEVLQVSVPSLDLLEQLIRWLDFLSDEYLQYVNSTSENCEPDMKNLAVLISRTIQSAMKMVRKARATVIQYDLLRQKIHLLTAHGPHTLKAYGSAWNMVQVYSGVCHVYVQYMTECAEGMHQLCTITDALNTDFVNRFADYI